MLREWSGCIYKAEGSLDWPGLQKSITLLPKSLRGKVKPIQIPTHTERWDLKMAISGVFLMSKPCQNVYALLKFPLFARFSVSSPFNCLLTY